MLNHNKNSDFLTIDSLSISYGLAPVIHDFSCSVRKGEFVVIVGRSGSGKTSILNAIANLIAFNGKIRKNEKFGYVFQNYSLFPWLTVQKNLELALHETSSAQRNVSVNSVLTKTELSEFATRYPSQLSGGQVQRVAIARALAPRPELLLMDEPFSALDHFTRDKMQRWLLNIWQEFGTTILFVTHYIDEAVFMADRILVLKEGSLASEFNVNLERPRSKELRSSEQFVEIKRRILEAMD